MKTAMQELIEEMKEYNMILVKEGIEPNPLIQMLKHKAKKLLEKEKEQIMNDYKEGVNKGILYCNGEVFISKEEYYNQTYNQTNNLWEQE